MKKRLKNDEIGKMRDKGNHQVWALMYFTSEIISGGFFFGGKKLSSGTEKGARCRAPMTRVRDERAGAHALDQYKSYKTLVFYHGATCPTSETLSFFFFFLLSLTLEVAMFHSR